MKIIFVLGAIIELAPHAMKLNKGIIFVYMKQNVIDMRLSTSKNGAIKIVIDFRKITNSTIIHRIVMKLK